MNTDLNKIFWLWIPLIYIGVQLIAEIVLPQSIMAPMHNENGPVETLQFLIISAAFITAILTLTKMKNIKPKWLIGWISLAALCCLYVAGEEVSWGQHILDWSTPEFWAGVNDQNETNLHNTSSWFDQKPRLILLIGVVVGGLIIPLLQRFKPSILPKKFESIFPPATLGIIAAVALSTNLLDKIFELFTGHPFLSRGSEIEELYLFYFVLLYLIALRRRLLQ